VEDSAGYLKEGEGLSLQSFDGIITNVELPKNVYLEVTMREYTRAIQPASVLKDATLETGLVVKVPSFIKNW